MEYQNLGRSGLKISVLTMGTMTFGGTGGFASVGSTGVDEARRQVDMCLDAGVNLIDTADVYSGGLSEEIVGEVLRGRRDQVLIATKVGSEVSDAGERIAGQADALADRRGPAHALPMSTIAITSP